MTACQIKCNTSPMNASLAVCQSRHFCGRLLIKRRARASFPSLTLAKSVFFGKNSRRSPFPFSLLPRFPTSLGRLEMGVPMKTASLC